MTAASVSPPAAPLPLTANSVTSRHSAGAALGAARVTTPVPNAPTSSVAASVPATARTPTGRRRGRSATPASTGALRRDLRPTPSHAPPVPATGVARGARASSTAPSGWTTSGHALHRPAISTRTGRPRWAARRRGDREAGAVRVGAATHGDGDVVDEQRHATRRAVDPQPHHRRGGHGAAEPVDELATAPHRPHPRPSSHARTRPGPGRGGTGHTAPDRPRAVSIGERAGAWVRFRTSRRSLPECKAAATPARPAGRRPAAGAGSRRRPPGASCA